MMRCKSPCVVSIALALGEVSVALDQFADVQLFRVHLGFHTQLYGN